MVRLVRFGGALAVLLGAAGVAMAQGDAGSDAPPPPPPPRPDAPAVSAPSRPEEVDAEVRYKGPTAPGSRITLGPDGPPDPDASYRWAQSEGPKAAIDDPAKPRITIAIPEGARRLAFILTVKDRQGERSARVVVPVREADDPSAVRADAGDDQIGLVGRRITLNGSGSTPRDKATFRWIQLGGPKVEGAAQERAFYAFTPSAPGIYRFGLIVASSGALSDIDDVVVTVGEPPATPGNDLGMFGGAGQNAMLDVAAGAARGLADRATLDQVAAAFDAVAERASLYSTFGDLSSELTRRLDTLVPSDPRGRGLWMQYVFAPLTQHMAAELFPLGVDLRTPQGHQQPLQPAQKDRLHAILKSCARGFRAQSGAR